MPSYKTIVLLTIKILVDQKFEQIMVFIHSISFLHKYGKAVDSLTKLASCNFIYNLSEKVRALFILILL
jgi:hypothetical protein